MDDNTFRFDIRLGTGFFRSELYMVTISQNSISLSNASKTAYQFDKKDVKFVGIIRSVPAEIEIITSGKIFIGKLSRSADINLISHILETSFGKKFEE